jgi:prepilin-type N-terminal cleavage/methylation domain-containing protein
MKPTSPRRQAGFTLLETVIAIGVLAVLLTGFLIVFTPAAEGIRKSINIEQADRMATALEQEIGRLRVPISTPPTATGFAKAFDWIKDSNKEAKAILVYQYRGNLDPTKQRADGTALPMVDIAGKLPGKDYTVIPMVRLKDDPKLFQSGQDDQGDLAAIEGATYLVKCKQLIITKDNEMVAGKIGEIVNPKPKPDPDTEPPYNAGPFNSAAEYPEAIIAFQADFYLLPEKNAAYVKSNTFTTRFQNLNKPVFSRNLAVRY